MHALSRALALIGFGWRLLSPWPPVLPSSLGASRNTTQGIENRCMCFSDEIRTRAPGYLGTLGRHDQITTRPCLSYHCGATNEIVCDAPHTRKIGSLIFLVITCLCSCIRCLNPRRIDIKHFVTIPVLCTVVSGQGFLWKYDAQLVSRLSQDALTLWLAGTHVNASIWTTRQWTLPCRFSSGHFACISPLASLEPMIPSAYGRSYSDHSPAV